MKKLTNSHHVMLVYKVKLLEVDRKKSDPQNALFAIISISE